MRPAVRESLDAYYREAGSWAEDRQDSLRASRRVAWIVASIAIAAAIFEAVAIAVMMPLKSVEPYTLMVDKTTGYVQELKPIDAQKIAPDTALTQSFLVQYVIAREGYDRNTVKNDYRKVVLWSSGTAQADYKNGMQSANPASPLNLPTSTVIDTRVKSVSSLSSTSALVRFETTRRDAGGVVQPPQSWVVVIDYRFSTGPMSTEDRYVNPLGFQVSRYRRDQEAASAPQMAPPPAAVVPAPAPGATTVPGAPQPQVTTPNGTNPISGGPQPVIR